MVDRVGVDVDVCVDVGLGVGMIWNVGNIVYSLDSG